MEQPCSSILKHDPLTIISNAKFDVKLALLVDYHLLSSAITTSATNSSKSLLLEPLVDVRLLKEEEIGTVLCEGLQAMLQAKPSFNIINKAEPTYSLEDTVGSCGGQRLTISITCMLKVDINRRGHNPKALPVAEEKFKFLFFTSLEEGLLGRQCVLHTFSLPVNVLSRKDYRNSYATILWDCAFALDGRRLFEVREVVSWAELAAALSAKWRKDVGVYLEEHHLEFIATMVPNSNNNNNNQLQQHPNSVSWEQFAKIPMPARDFTFFEWFYRSLILVREQLLSLYTDGLVHGFISSEVAEALLLDCVDGTFLLRFSETYCGAISVAYVTERRFAKLFPWDLDRLRKISLAHTVKCSNFLLYLYPNVPKDEVFCKYYVTGEDDRRSVTGKDYKRDTNIAQVITGDRGSSSITGVDYSANGGGYRGVGGGGGGEMMVGSPGSTSSGGGFFMN